MKNALLLLILLSPVLLDAQAFTVELNAAVGMSPDQSFSSSSSFETTVVSDFGPPFRVERPALFTQQTDYLVQSRGLAQIGVEAHYALSARSSVYVGLQADFRRLTYSSQSARTDLEFTGPETSTPVEPGTGSGANPIGFCPGESISFSSTEEEPRVAQLAIAVPVGYRFSLLGDRLALRAQVTTVMPVLNRMRQRSDRFVFTAENCIAGNIEDVDLRPDYRITAPVFRAGLGADVNLTYRFALGLLVEQSLSRLYERQFSSLSLNDNDPLQDYRPLDFRLVARYKL